MNDLSSAARHLALEQQVAWYTHVMARMAEQLAPDADFVNVLGKHWKGAQ